MRDLLGPNFKKAKEEGRVCEICGWMITKIAWKKIQKEGTRKLCAGHFDALKGVNVQGGYGKYRDEPVDRTGDML